MNILKLAMLLLCVGLSSAISAASHRVSPVEFATRKPATVAQLVAAEFPEAGHCRRSGWHCESHDACCSGTCLQECEDDPWLGRRCRNFCD